MRGRLAAGAAAFLVGLLVFVTAAVAALPRLDPSFGTGGVTYCSIPFCDGGPLTVAPEGQIYDVDSNGVSAFLPSGKVAEAFGGGFVVPPQTGGQDSSVAVQRDGKVLVAGSWAPADVFGPPEAASAFVTRLLPDGKLDPTFGTDGIVWPERKNLAVAGYLPELDVLPNGDILVASVYQGGDPMSIIRLLPSGKLDPTFANGNLKLPAHWGGIGLAYLTVLADGDIFVLSTGPSGTAIAGLLPDGKINRGFGTNGLALLTPKPNFASDLTADHGELLVLMENCVVRRLTRTGQMGATFSSSRAGYGCGGPGSMVADPPDRIVVTTLRGVTILDSQGRRLGQLDRLGSTAVTVHAGKLLVSGIAGDKGFIARYVLSAMA